jgi:N-acetylmuramoyl-L-alanine amidase
MSFSIRDALFAVASFCVLGLSTAAAPSLAGGYAPTISSALPLDTIDSDSLTQDNDRIAADVPSIAGDPSISAVPAVRSATLAGLVADNDDDATADNRDEECLASTVYYEAKSESLEGQLAVAEVVLNRTRSGRFPTSICSVITQPSQFGFVRAGRYATPPQSSLAWKRALAIARIAVDGDWQSNAANSLYFHAARVAPRWANVTRVTQIGAHIFYR